MKIRFIVSALILASSARTEAQSTNTPVIQLDEVVVTAALNEARFSIIPNLGATSYQIGPSQLEAQSQGENAPFNQVILRAPGVAQDSYGQLHIRGEHANLQYRIDGVILPEGITGFGLELDSHFFSSLQLVTGSLPAQYGFRTAGIIDVQTKSGATNPGGEVYVHGGSFDTFKTGLQDGGTAGRLTWYLNSTYLHSGLGIENPVGSSTPIHDYTDQYKNFVDLSYLIDASSRLNLIVSSSYADFQIPNNPGQPPNFTLSGVPTFHSANLDENQHEQNDYAVLTYQKSAGDLNYQISAFSRYSATLFTPDKHGDLIFNGTAGTVDRSILYNGLQLDTSYRINEAHTLRGGLLFNAGGTTTRTTTLVFPTDADGNQSSSEPFAIRDNSYKLGLFYGAYLQDEWKITKEWTVNYGGRFDVVDAFTHENHFSPRINTTLELPSHTTLHAGYAHYFTPPPLESIQTETIAKFANTTNAPENFVNSPVRSENSDYFDAGITQQVTEGFKIGLDGYYKIARQQLDEGQFGSALIFTPFNYKRGRIYGAELTANYARNGFSAYGNFSYSVAKGEEIDSAQFTFGADELAYIRNHYIFLDHNQTFTASAGVSYKWGDTLAAADMIYGNGLREGFVNRGKLPAYATVNLGLEHKFKLSSSTAFKVRFDVVNLFDQVYEIRSGTGVGVGAPQFGARRGFYGTIGFEF